MLYRIFAAVAFVFLTASSGPVYAAGPAVGDSPPTAEAALGRVEGTVLFMEKPVAGVEVYAVEDADGIFTDESRLAVTTTGTNGAFSLELPKGRYYIAARKGKKEDVLEPGDLYCFYGGNPVVVEPARPAEIVLHTVMKPETREGRESEEDKGAVEGVVTLDGKPFEGASLSVYSDSKGLFRGRSSSVIQRTGADGRFKIKLDEGTWYVIARKRMNGAQTGPLYEGDYFGYLDTNPIVVKKGEVRSVEIPVAKKLEKTSPGGHGYTHIEGLIKDDMGNPASGIFVCLYRNGSMSGRPAFISKATGRDGAFTMDLPIDGKFFLAARSSIGGPLAPGQFWGKYSGSPDHSIAIEAGGTIKGLDIEVARVSAE